jgi:uncharacterized protein
MKVAIVGSGISGLAAAHTLQGAAEITLYAGSVTHGVDTGFLVFNERTYPELIKLFAELGVVTTKSDMSFSVQSQSPRSGQRMEWSGTSLNALFAQRSNLINWRFWRMLSDILRFNSLCTLVARQDNDRQMRQTVGEFLKDNGFSDEFRDGYFLPMAACIWSCPTAQMLAFPMATMIRFCHNHGLLQISNRPQWWTVQGGAKHYVEKITAGIADKRLNTPVRSIERLGHDASDLSRKNVRITTDHTQEYFDAVIVATHSDEALALLKAPTQLERTLLGAIKYHANRAVLHTDASVLPTRKAAWAAWNYERAVDISQPTAPAVCLHYLINRLQPLPWSQPVVVSLNPLRSIGEQYVLGTYAYSHPVFDTPAIKAQRQIPWLQGQQNTYYCGAWVGYGFHEDGLKAGELAATQLLNHHGQAAS